MYTEWVQAAVENEIGEKYLIPLSIESSCHWALSQVATEHWVNKHNSSIIRIRSQFQWFSKFLGPRYTEGQTKISRHICIHICAKCTCYLITLHNEIKAYNIGYSKLKTHSWLVIHDISLIMYGCNKLKISVIKIKIQSINWNHLPHNDNRSYWTQYLDGSPCVLCDSWIKRVGLQARPISW